MGHKQLILEELEKGTMLSKLEIWQKYNCLNQAGRINDLRNDGNDIRHIMCKNKNTGKRYAKYYLVAPGVRRVF